MPGLETEWRIIKGADEFFNVTKAIHNAIQGDPHGLNAEEQEIFRRYQGINAQEFDDSDYDFVVVHDPQPIGMIEHFPDSKAKWIWRGHIDFSAPNQQVMEFLLPWLRRYDAAIFHLEEYVPKAEGFRTHTSGRRRSIRSRRRTWRSRPRTRRTSSTSSASTSSGRC